MHADDVTRPVLTFFQRGRLPRGTGGFFSPTGSLLQSSIGAEILADSTNLRLALLQRLPPFVSGVVAGGKVMWMLGRGTEHEPRLALGDEVDAPHPSWSPRFGEKLLEGIQQGLDGIQPLAERRTDRIRLHHLGVR